MASFYPISLNIQGKLCLVIGGGAVAFRKAKNKFAQALKEAQKAAKANPKLRYNYGEVRDKDKSAPKPPQKDYEVEFHHVLDDYPKAFWRPKLPFNPDGCLSRFQCKWLGLFHPPAEEPRNKDNMLMCEYALLAAIHDEALDIPACDRLTDRDKDDWVELLWKNVSHGGVTMDDILTYGDRMRNINTAFNDVEADLAKKEVETEQETEPQEKDRQEQTITLKDFIKKHCDLSERPDIDSKCVSIGTRELTCHGLKHNTAKAKGIYTILINCLITGQPIE